MANLNYYPGKHGNQGYRRGKRQAEPPAKYGPANDLSAIHDQADLLADELMDRSAKEWSSVRYRIYRELMDASGCTGNNTDGYWQRRNMPPPDSAYWSLPAAQSA